VLKLGAFESRISVADDGHLAETFRYAAGVVRVSDGIVASVELQ
jgi:hydrogenase maturation factor HypE